MNENTDLGEDDTVKASSEKIAAAAKVVSAITSLPAGWIPHACYFTVVQLASLILKKALNDIGVTGMT